MDQIKHQAEIAIDEADAIILLLVAVKELLMQMS